MPMASSNKLETISYHGYRDGYNADTVVITRSHCRPTSSRRQQRRQESTLTNSPAMPRRYGQQVLKQIPRTTYERRFSIKAWNAACPEDHGTLARRS